jgi:hypothetical protein
MKRLTRRAFIPTVTLGGLITAVLDCEGVPSTGITVNDIQRASLVFSSGSHQFLMDGKAKGHPSNGQVEIVAKIPMNLPPGVYTLVSAQAWTADSTWIYDQSDLPSRQIRIEASPNRRTPVRPPLRLS